MLDEEGGKEERRGGQRDPEPAPGAAIPDRLSLLGREARGPGLRDRHRQAGQGQRGVLPESHGRVGPLVEAMAENVTWRWMGVSQWSRTFEGKQRVIDTLFAGSRDMLSPGSSVQILDIHGDGDFVIVEHSGHNELPDGRQYDNNYCWVFRFQDGLIQEVRSTWTPSWSPRHSGLTEARDTSSTDHVLLEVHRSALKALARLAP